MTDLEIAKTLKGAAQYIRDHGWYQGSVTDGDGRVCALGAIAAAMDRWTDHRSPYYSEFPDICADEVLPIQIACEEAIERNLPFLGQWNDESDRTAAEVIDLFESVALQHELRALAVTTLSQDAATAVCDNTVPEAVNA